MRLLLENAHLVDPERGETRTGQIFIENGIISSFENQAAERVIDCNGKYLAPGLVDIGRGRRDNHHNSPRYIARNRYPRNARVHA